MIMTPLVLLYIIMLAVSSLFCISAPSWLGAWVGLEFNLMSFIPVVMLMGRKDPSPVMVYFLVQAFSSMLFLVSVVLLASFLPSYGQAGVPGVSLLMMAALLIKLGGAPFHMWVPVVSGALGWWENFIMLTWQKLAPLILFFYVINLNIFVVLVVMLSSFIGSVGGLNQTSLRKIFAYSSINHLGWMVSAMFASSVVLVSYYLIYMLTSFILVYLFDQLGLFYISQVMNYGQGFHIGVMYLNLFSFGGLPPFLGFVPKWLVLDGLLSFGMVFVSLFLILMSLLSLFYYVRLGYVSYSQSSSLVYSSPVNQSLGLPVYIMSSITVGGMLCVPLFLSLV